MFDSGRVARSRPHPAHRQQTAARLQARIRELETGRPGATAAAGQDATPRLPTHPALAPLLDGGLRAGAAYRVEQSATLLMALLAAPSAAGSWCAVVGVPEFGAEAAQRYGIELDRLVLVPRPGDQWLNVTAAVAEVMDVVVTRPGPRAGAAATGRLAGRLRSRGTTLLVLGAWPQAEAVLSLSSSDWHGLGLGRGHLTAREATVTVTTRVGGQPRSARLWLPDRDEQFRGLARVAERSGVEPVEPVRALEATG